MTGLQGASAPPTATATLPSATTSRPQRPITISKGWLASFSHRAPTPAGNQWCGHNSHIRLHLTGPPDHIGMVWDFGALGAAKAVFDQADHRHPDDLLPGLPAPCDDTA